MKKSVEPSVLRLFGQKAVQLEDEWVARDFLNKMIQIKVDPQPGLLYYFLKQDENKLPLSPSASTGWPKTIHWT